MAFFIIMLVWVVTGTLAFFLLRRQFARMYLAERLYGEEVNDAEAPPSASPVFLQWVRRWFMGAGYKTPYAVYWFGLAVSIFFAAGAAAWMLLRDSALLMTAAFALENVPGHVGEIFIPAILFSPYITWILIASMPWVWIRARRRKRLESAEQDLPVFLEFLVSLSEAGLSFDEALSRILEVQGRSRPLPRAFHRFQAEIRSGQSRLRSYWRLRDRAPVPGVRNLISAMIQSEQSGGRVGDILRHQASDSLTRRRLKAVEMATALPVKLLFPMMVCFLPSIFVAVLGPVFYRFIEVMDSFIRTAS